MTARISPLGAWPVAQLSGGRVLTGAVSGSGGAVLPVDSLRPVETLAIADKLKPPSAAHWFGTDHLGRDVFSMVMVGARTSIAVALLAVGIGVALGAPLGLAAAAARGGWLDEMVMRATTWSSPSRALLIAIMITAVFGPGAVNAIIAIGIFNMPVFARLTRGAALTLWTRDFALAARVAGKGKARISAEHILPNLTNLLLVQATIQFSLGILAEAGLSYVGLGAQPPTAKLGPDAGRGADADFAGAAHGAVSRLRDRHDGAGAQPDGRRAARRARPAAEAGAMSLLTVEGLSLSRSAATAILRGVSFAVAAARPSA
jgi:peptide/nickel transport system permease protein